MAWTIGCRLRLNHPKPRRRPKYFLRAEWKEAGQDYTSTSETRPPKKVSESMGAESAGTLLRMSVSLQQTASTFFWERMMRSGSTDRWKRLLLVAGTSLVDNKNSRGEVHTHL